MEKRLHIESKGRKFFAEADDNEQGMIYLKGLRTLKQFKGQYIKSVLQAYPSKVKKFEITYRD